MPTIFQHVATLIGGLLMVFAFGPGGFSAEVLMPRRRTAGQF